MAKRSVLTAARLRELLHYNPSTGKFTRVITERAKRKVGRDAHGYLSIGVDYQRYLAHRLAFLYMTGKWPDGDVDHIDGDPSNNCWSNLRSVTRSQNNLNRHRLDARNKSGHTGVRWHEKMKKWQAICSYTFDTRDEAVAARDAMRNAVSRHMPIG